MKAMSTFRMPLVLLFAVIVTAQEPEMGFFGILATPAVADGLGSLASADASTLQGLMMADLSMLKVVLEPCSMVRPHTHPHSEVLYVESGSITPGIISMNGSMPELSTQTIEASSFVTFPTGLVHSTTNENCESAALVVFFPTGAPMTSFFPASVSALPSNVLEASLPGLGDGDAIREVFAQQTGAFASLGEDSECMMRCGMQASNGGDR